MNPASMNAKLTPEQRTQLQKAIGQNTQDLWNKTIASDEYKGLNDADKKKALEGIMNDVSAVEKRKFAAANGLGQYSSAYTGEQKALSAKQTALGESYDNFDLGNYTGGSIGKVAGNLSSESKKTLTQIKAMSSDKRDEYLKDPKNDYNYEYAKFENDVKNGKLSDVDQYNKLQALGKQKIQSNYSREAIELYGLSKTKLNDFIKKNPQKQSVLDEVVAMDNKLADEGFISKPKFGGGIGSKSGSGGGGRGGKAKKAPEPPLPKFGSFSLVDPPVSPSPTMNSVLQQFKAALAGIPVLQGTQVAPGDESSDIKISTV